MEQDLDTAARLNINPLIWLFPISTIISDPFVFRDHFRVTNLHQNPSPPQISSVEGRVIKLHQIPKLMNPESPELLDLSIHMEDLEL